MKKTSKMRGVLVCSLAVTMCVPAMHTIRAKDTSGRIEAMLNKMTLEQKIEQMIMPDFRQWKVEGAAGVSDMTTLNDEVAQIIDKYDFGGVILFANNVKETEQTLKLTDDMQNAAIKNKAGNGNIPLMITIDQEGGIVYRLGSGTALPGNMALGATNSTSSATQAGEVIGRELSALGLNVNFAPVFDTNSNPNNPVIGLRSISSDPNLVAKLGVPMMKGMQEYNVATAAKHFPGHGDTATDSHTGLPMVDRSYEELKNSHLIPFQAAIDNGVDMLMTAHIQFPQIEKDQVISKSTNEKINIPATLSDDIITGIAREKMGFEGVVVTDAMNMDAISKNFGESQAVIMAMQADVDICLMPTTLRQKSDLAKLDTIIQDVVKAVKSGELDETTLNKSVIRILKLKEKRGMLDYGSDTSTWEEKLAKANTEVGSEQNRAIEREIAAKAVTMVKNEKATLPMKPQGNEKVLLLAAYNNELPGMDLGMRRLIDEGVLDKDTQYETLRYSSNTTIDSLKEKFNGVEYVVVISEIGSAANLKESSWLTRVPTEVIDYANAQGISSAILSIQNPYDVANYPNANAILACYGNKGMDPTEGLQPDKAFGPNISAGIEAIFGGHEITGKLPVDIPMIKDHVMDTTQIAYPIGYGLSYDDIFKEATVKAPDKVKLGDNFSVEIDLGKGFYDMAVSAYYVSYDPKNFLCPDDEMTSDPEGGLIRISNQHMDKKFNVTLKAKQLGEYNPITEITVVDEKGRHFHIDENIFNTIKVNVVETLDPANPDPKPEDPTKPADPAPETPKKPDTGKNNKTPGTGDTTTDIFALSMLALLSLGAVIIIKKRKAE